MPLAIQKVSGEEKCRLSFDPVRVIVYQLQLTVISNVFYVSLDGTSPITNIWRFGQGFRSNF
jgi:hypothetical protein